VHRVLELGFLHDVAGTLGDRGDVAVAGQPDDPLDDIIVALLVFLVKRLERIMVGEERATRGQVVRHVGVQLGGAEDDGEVLHFR